MRQILSLLFLFKIGVLFSGMNPDSLRLVLQSSTKRNDFRYVDSIITATNAAYNSLEVKKLVQVALKRSQDLKFELIEGKFLLRQSIIETLSGNFAPGMNDARDALKILSKYNAIETSACYNTIAGMVAYFGDVEAAKEYMRKADQICALFRGHPYYFESRCNNHLMWGNIYLSSGSLALGEQHILQSLKIANQHGITTAEIYARLNLSKLAIIEKDFERANQNLDIALELSKANKIYNLEAITDIKIAQNFEAEGKPEAAIVKYLQAEQLALTQDLGDRLLTIYKSLSKLYKERGNLKASFQYQEKYIKAYETQKKNEKAEQLEMLQVKFKMSERNAMIANLALDKENKEAQNNFFKLAIFVTITIIIILILITLLIYNKNLLERKLAAEKTEKAIANYQMTALKSQMNPHFIFNALNSIQDLILKGQAEESYRYINKFADLVRKTLNHSNQNFIDIDDEFSSIEVYLALERLRFKEDLQINFITNNISGIKIPPLLIQPFIENSIKHGLLHKKGSKQLTIRFDLGQRLRCVIEDNGIGRKASREINKRRAKGHESFATSAISGRFDILKNIYGPHVGFTYTDLENEGIATGTIVIINLPFQQIY
ncbi:tetratricopeptide repeat-containing sensor histidine kinase [Crocinitomix algicola]|uniref:tetratricopeptide repeat-containing sensor histidine kinase n=1 Tax=Crocinitomix algicola TaxID=1740263 RepID=UPI000872F7CD|nr:histidine kinase [Crocinitomix algicola]